MSDCDKLKDYISDNYQYLKGHIISFCLNQHYTWDEDIFHDTLVKCIDIAQRKGLRDSSEKGMENYIFMSYKLNTMRERQYCRVSKRDNNVEDVSGVYERYLDGAPSIEDKVGGDMFADFSAIYLASAAEKACMEGELTAEQYHLWRFKSFTDLTYRRLTEITGCKGIQNKVKEVRQWLRENVTLEDVKEAFDMFMEKDKND